MASSLTFQYPFDDSSCHSARVRNNDTAKSTIGDFLLSELQTLKSRSPHSPNIHERNLICLGFGDKVQKILRRLPFKVRVVEKPIARNLYDIAPIKGFRDYSRGEIVDEGDLDWSMQTVST